MSKEAKGGSTRYVRQDGEKVKRKTQQLENAENPSTAGYLMTENHTLKPHDSGIITMNLNQMEQVQNFVQEIEDKVKSNLQSLILANGKIKAGRRASYKFDEDVIQFLN